MTASGAVGSAGTQHPSYAQWRQNAANQRWAGRRAHGSPPYHSPWGTEKDRHIWSSKEIHLVLSPHQGWVLGSEARAHFTDCIIWAGPGSLGRRKAHGRFNLSKAPEKPVDGQERD